MKELFFQRFRRCVLNHFEPPIRESRDIRLCGTTNIAVQPTSNSKKVLYDRHFYEKEESELRRMYGHPEPFIRYEHKLRMKWIIELIFDQLPYSTYFLEVGCGVSPYVPLAATYCSFSVGLDIASSKIMQLKMLFHTTLKEFENRVDFVVADAQKLPFRNKSFNKLLCSEVLEHLHNPDQAIQEISRVAYGEVVISVPGLGTLPGYIYKRLIKKSLFEDEHIQFFFPKDLINNFRKVCFRVTDVIGSGNAIFFLGTFIIRPIINRFSIFGNILKSLDIMLNKTYFLNKFGLYLVIKCVKKDYAVKR